MDKFKKQAVSLGLCQEWQDSWEESGLIEKYLHGITWCMKNEFPSLKDMKRYDEALLRNGVYNNKRAEIVCDRDMYVFNASEIDFTIDEYKVCRIYAGRGSKLRVTVKDHAILYIDNYNSSIEVIKGENAKCLIWDK